MMVGARWEHNIISQNIAYGLRQQLKARRTPCRVFLETFYMKNKTIESATLLDVMVVGGPMLVGATSADDSVILVEVLSRGSASRDREQKRRAYRRLTSLQHYVLVEQDAARVHVHDRAGDVWAALRSVEGLDGTLALPSLDLGLPLAEIYEDIFSA